MKLNLLIIAFFISSVTFAQTKVNVTVQSNSFTPSVVNITVGDTVEWTNIGGSHNVNGTQSTFSSNPASFGNSVGTGWTYSFKFTAAGTYNYQCDPHVGFGMVGIINVQVATNVREELIHEKNQFYPNPATNQLTFTDYKNIEKITFYTLTGEKVIESNLTSNTLNIENLDAGIYFVKISAGKNTSTKKLIIQ